MGSHDVFEKTAMPQAMICHLERHPNGSMLAIVWASSNHHGSNPGFLSVGRSVRF
jgi:hypothetical protein